MTEIGGILIASLSACNTQELYVCVCVCVVVCTVGHICQCEPGSCVLGLLWEDKQPGKMAYS